MKAPLARDEELDGLFEHIYENNVSGKLSDDRFAKMSKRYEQEQGENAGQIKALRLELKKLEDKRMDVDTFLETVRRYYAEYQSVYGLHIDTDHLHLHFAINTVSYKTGKMYAGGLSDWHRLQGYIQGLMPQWYVELRVSNGRNNGENDLAS